MGDVWHSMEGKGSPRCLKTSAFSTFSPNVSRDNLAVTTAITYTTTTHPTNDDHDHKDTPSPKVLQEKFNQIHSFIQSSAATARLLESPILKT
jgi:hypothetical protein